MQLSPCRLSLEHAGQTASASGGVWLGIALIYLSFLQQSGGGGSTGKRTGWDLAELEDHMLTNVLHWTGDDSKVGSLENGTPRDTSDSLLRTFAFWSCTDFI